MNAPIFEQLQEHQVFSRQQYLPRPLNDGTGRHAEILGAVYDVPLGANVCRLHCTREDWPDVDERALRCSAEVSFDGGDTWGLLLSFTAYGKSARRQGNAHGDEESWAQCPIGQQTNACRKLRVSIIPMKHITTQVSIILGRAQ